MNDDFKLIIKSLIVSSAKTFTVREIEYEFYKMEGYRIPYQKMGFSSMAQFLRSMDDFQVFGGYDSTNALVTCTVSENVRHIHKMVMEQRPPKCQSRSHSQQRNRNLAICPPLAPCRMRSRNLPTRGYKSSFMPILEHDDDSDGVKRQTNNKNDFTASTDSNNDDGKHFNDNSSYQTRTSERFHREKVCQRIARLSGNMALLQLHETSSDEKENAKVIESEIIENNNNASGVAKKCETPRCLNKVRFSQILKPLGTNTSRTQDSNENFNKKSLDLAISEDSKDKTKAHHENRIESVEKDLPKSIDTNLVELTHPTTAERCQEAIPDYTLRVERLFYNYRDEPIVDTTADFKESFKWARLRKDSHIKLFITEVHSPFKFWFQEYSTEDKFRRMHSTMQTFYLNPKYDIAYAFSESCVVPGRICAALFQGIWHRAKILSCIIDEKVKVLYVDFGTVGYVTMRDLRHLTQEFNLLPKQALRGWLINIEPIGCHWTQHVTTNFVQKVLNKRLTGRIAELNDRTRTAYLMLYHEGKTQTTLINNALVVEGFANPDYEWIQQKSLRRPHKRENYPSFEMLESGEYPTFTELVELMARGIDHEATVDQKFSTDLVNFDRKYKHLAESLDFPLFATDPFCFEILNKMAKEKEKRL